MDCSSDQSPPQGLALDYSHLLWMPAELLYMVYQHLELEDAAALTLTCRHFYRSDIASKCLRQFKETSPFGFLCLLEDIGLIPGYRCQGCLQRHSWLDFSCEELRKRARSRYCLRTKKCFQFTFKGRESSFNDMVKFYVSPKRRPNRVLINKSRVNRPRPKVSMSTIDTLCPAGFAPTKDDFIAFCSEFNIPICPHMCLSDTKITSQFPPFKHPTISKTCEHCDTDVQLIEETYSSKSSLYRLKVTRHVGSLQSPRDPVWLAHTFAEKDACLTADYYEGVNKWVRDVPGTLYDGRPLPDRPLHLEPRNGCFFTPATLPEPGAQSSASSSEANI